MLTLDALKTRTSANNFDATRSITDAQIRKLVSHATQAPSSFNIQHWRFLAINDKAAQARLRAVAFNQPKVADAGVTFVILGDLKGYEKLAEAYAPLVQKGVMTQAAVDGVIAKANAMYHGNPQIQRDEAIRSGSLAAMALMLAATEMGLVSAPMIGFDPAGVKKECGISDQYVPVMLLAVGYAAPGNWPRKPRFAVDQVLGINKMPAF